MELRTLDCVDIVFRAVIRTKHWSRDTRRPLAAAFLLRTSPNGTREGALSVSYDCSPQECADDFNKCYGVASLHVGRVRNLGLDVIPDEPNHANVTGLPHPADNPAEAERFARELRRQARPVWPE